MSQNACPARLMLLQSIHTVTSNARSASGLGQVDNSSCVPIAAATPEALAVGFSISGHAAPDATVRFVLQTDLFPGTPGPRCDLACIIMMMRSTLIG